ncbi:Hypothetical predicted protein [Olea europaea subsp. europaea]|uniref:Uncharacterized protein n=1 Tax=Olea europaea subsp. europaea TaxID=158383 RepID=A0A8S0VLF3_OLEEU|nr:Hypothetical predicted protein [Olea europaea subsp. europaea]
MPRRSFGYIVQGSVPSFESVDDFLQKVATIRGRLKGVVLWISMLLLGSNEGEPSEPKIVAGLGKEFNTDEVSGDFNPVEVPSNGSLNFDVKMLEVCDLSTLSVGEKKMEKRKINHLQWNMTCKMITILRLIYVKESAMDVGFEDNVADNTNQNKFLSSLWS